MSMWTLVLLSVLLAFEPLHSTPVHHKEKTATRDDNYRLLNVVQPTSYNIQIDPSYTEIPLQTFLGSITITVTIKKEFTQLTPNKIIELHKGANIEILMGYLNSDYSFYAIKEDDFTTDINTEKLIIDITDAPFIESLKEGDEIEIILIYQATFTEDLTGIYAAPKEVDPTQCFLLATNFKPTHARKVFPCFDEPEFKATFQLYITLDDGVGAISNMEVDDYDETQRVLHFRPTPVMSTYHLSFTIYKKDCFDSIAEATQSGDSLQFQMWGSKTEAPSERPLSYVEVPAALHFMKLFTGMSYVEHQMTKMDMAAIQNLQPAITVDWGLIMYSENTIPYNDHIHYTATYKQAMEAIYFGLSHMWFGNLVTAKWWNNVWLNEIFARYMQYLLAHDRYPNWHMLERFVLDEQMSAFGVDADASAEGISKDKTSVETPEQIEEVFDTISYSKGAAILRQISNAMGEENFKKGVQKYFQDNAFKSTTSGDLFASLAAANDEKVSLLKSTQLLSVLERWTELPGYPVINVTRSGKTQFTITQERFLLIKDEDDEERGGKDESGDEEEDESGNSVDDEDSADTRYKGEKATAVKYPVYLTWITSKDESPVMAPKSPQQWLEEDEIVIDISGLGYSDWALFNAYQGGYYRVNYDDSTWAQIIYVLDQNEGANLDLVAPVDRAALVDNALALARAGYISYPRAFQVIRFLRHDTAFEPWAAARSALAHLQSMLGHEKPFKDFVTYIVEKAYNATSFDDGRMLTHIEKEHRTNILALACSVGYEPCLQDAKELLHDILLKDDREGSRSSHINMGPLHPDLESVVFCYGLKGASPQVWEKLWSDYIRSDAAQRHTFISALGCIDHRETLREFLLRSLDTELVHEQDAYRIFESVYNNLDNGPQVALDFLTFWGCDNLEERYGVVKNAMPTLISGLAEKLTTEKQKNQLQVVFQQSDSCYKPAMKTVRNNIDWINTHRITVIASLSGTQPISLSSGVRYFSTPLMVIISIMLMILLH